MDASELITAVLVVMIVYAMAVSVLRTLVHRIASRTHRHDMIVEARRRRAAYLQSVAERQAKHAASSGVMIEE